MNRHTIVASLFLALSLAIASTVSAQWVETDWPNMATVRNIMVEGNNIYVGPTQSDSGISLSTDEGKTWEYRNGGMRGRYGVTVRSLAHIGSVLFAAVDTVGGNNDFIFSSRDTGKIWKQVWANNDVNSLCTIGTTVFAATSKGLFSSIDSGLHWNCISDTTLSFRWLSPIGSLLFICTSGGIIMVSSDSGKTFIKANYGIENTGILDLAGTSKKIFVGTFLKNGIVAYSSIDNGQHWYPIIDSFSGSQMNAVTMVGDRVFLGANNGKVFFSDDLGEHWINGSTGITRSSVMAFAATEKTLFDGTYAGGVWSRPLSEFTTSDVKSAEAQKGISVFPNPTTGLLHITNPTINRIEILNAIGQEVRMITNPSQTIDISELPAGFYTLKIVRDIAIETVTVVKE